MLYAKNIRSNIFVSDLSYEYRREICLFYEITIRNKVIVLPIKTALNCFRHHESWQQCCRIHYPPRYFHDLVIARLILYAHMD
jgi:hypothetical protein